MLFMSSCFNHAGGPDRGTQDSKACNIDKVCNLFIYLKDAVVSQTMSCNSGEDRIEGG